MSDPHLTIDEFFTRLTSLFNTRRASSHGSIYLTQKRLNPQSTTSPSSETPAKLFADLHPAKPLPVLIRATNGKSKEHRKNGEKVKISTVVQPEAIEGFFVRYAEVMKAGMSGLKKRDRSGRKRKEKERQKGKKKGEGKGEAG